MIDDETIKAEVEEELHLENERSQKSETTTWKKMEKVKRKSPPNAEFLKALFGLSTQEDLQASLKQYRVQRRNMLGSHYHDYVEDGNNKLEAEIARIIDDMSVTVNLTWANVMQTVRSGKIISLWENEAVMKERNTSGKYHYETRRDEIERMIGNRAKGGRKDAHPIYGAAASPNNRDEFYGGTGGGYGECYIKLKTERIKDRTSFCYDDSFDGYNQWMLDWEGGVIAKAIHNLEEGKSPHGYVEAQVLGGISLEDIESINIPLDAINSENKYGWTAGASVYNDIEILKVKYPDIKINIIDTPKK